MANTFLYSEFYSLDGLRYRVELNGFNYTGINETITSIVSTSSFTVQGDCTALLSASLAINLIHETTPGLNIATTVSSFSYDASTDRTTIVVASTGVTASYVTTTTTNAPSFEVEQESLFTSWDGEGGEILDTLKASVTRWTFYNRNTVGTSEVDYFINRYKYDQDNEWSVHVYKHNGTSFVLMWAGNVIYDQLSWNNEDQPTVEIQAVDGIGRLRDLRFDDAVNGIYTSKKTLLEWLQIILSKNQLSDYWGATDVFIESSIEFNSSISIMDATNGALENTRCRPSIFIDRESADEIRAITYHEALEGILKFFRARILHWNGRYYILQARNYRNTTYNYRNFYVGTYDAPDNTGTRTHGMTAARLGISADLAPLAGGRFTYYPPLNKVTSNIRRGQKGKNQAYGLYLIEVIDGTTETDSLSLPDVLGGSGNKLRIDIRINSQFAAVNSYMDITMNLNDGTNYFKQSLGGTATWTTSSSDRGYERVFQNGKDQIVSFFIDYMPGSSTTDYTATFLFDYDNTSANGWFTVEAAVAYFPIEGEELDPVEIEVLNPDFTNNSDGLHLDDLLIIDIWGNSSLQNLEVKTSTGPDVWGAAGSSWGGSYTALGVQWLSKLGAVEAMALQRTAKEIYQGTFKGEYEPHKSISYNNKVFVFNGGEFSYDRDEFSGEWFEIGADLTGLSIGEIKDTKGGYGDEEKLATNTGDLRNEFIHTNFHNLTTTDAVVSAGTVTSIDITQTGHTRIKSGDTIIALNPTTGAKIHTFTVSSDVASTDNSISVTSTSLPDDLPIGTKICFDPSKVVQADIVRVGSKNVQTSITQFRTVTIDNPTDSIDKTLFYTDQAITIEHLHHVIRGASAPSVDWTIRHSSDRSATGNEVVTSGTQTTTTTVVDTTSSFDDATIPGGSFVWLETTATSGTVNELNITIEYTED